MNLFRHLNIGKRLYLVSLLLIAALSALSLNAWIQLKNVHELASSAGRAKVLQLELIASTELKVTQVLLEIRQALLMKTPKDIAQAADHIQSARNQISQNDADFLKEITTQAGRDAFAHDWLQLQAST